MEKFKINSDQFLAYLESLGLFRWKIEIKETGPEAILGASPIPSLSNFSQIKKNEDGSYWVRLSHKDYNNIRITGGFFDKYSGEISE